MWLVLTKHYDVDFTFNRDRNSKSKQHLYMVIWQCEVARVERSKERENRRRAKKESLRFVEVRGHAL